MEDEKKYQPLLDIEKIAPLLNKISLFGGLTPGHLALLFPLLQSVSYKAGEIIFKQGEEPTHIYIVRSGEVKIIVNIDTRPLGIVTFSEGQCFGETSAIGIQPHSASAVAVVDTELIVLTTEALLSMFEHAKDLFGLLMLNLAREACRRLQKTDEVLLHYVHKEIDR
ncbi:MAG: cyclic nucleotide-binding domain-containing protein [Candidatus Omnitrophica bacterium]|nr:cyclic nucleotide-binding domain-containing protein [Candidatus Omnitrophota bacterium]